MFAVGFGRTKLELSMGDLFVRALGWEIYVNPISFERIVVSRPDGVAWCWPKAGTYRAGPGADCEAAEKQSLAPPSV